MYAVKDATDAALEELEVTLSREFPGVNLKLATQSFVRHVELWVYVLDLDQYSAVRERCKALSEEKHLEERTPEVWIIVKDWAGPWPGGESLQEIERRREEFKRVHNLKIGTLV